MGRDGTFMLPNIGRRNCGRLLGRPHPEAVPPSLCCAAVSSATLMQV